MRYFGAFLLIVSLTQSAFAAFPDVTSTHINGTAIEYVQSQGIVSGYPDGSYKPDHAINRAEFVKIVAGLLPDAAEIHCDPKNVLSFDDVDLNDADTTWYAKYLCIAKQKGLIDGYPDGTFKPAQVINFVEVAKIITAADVERRNVPDGLVSIPIQSGSWFQRFVNYLGDRKAIPTTIQKFDQSITRGEMAEIIYRIHANIANKNSTTYNDILINETPKSPSTTSTKERFLFDIGEEWSFDDFGFNRDGQTVAYVQQSAVGNKQTYNVIINGVSGPTYDAIGSLKVSPDGKHVVYLAFKSSNQAQVTLVVDDKEYPYLSALEGVNTMNLLRSSHNASFAGEHVAFTSMRTPSDTEKLQWVELPESCKTTIQAADQCLSMYGLTLDKYFSTHPAKIPIVDGKELGTFMDASNVVFSEDGARYAYAYQQDKNWFLARSDRNPMKLEGDCRTHITYSFSSDTLLCWGNAQRYAFRDGKRLYVPNIQNMHLSSDGKIAYVERAPSYGERLKFWEGESQPEFDRIGSLSFTPDGKHLAYSVNFSLPTGESGALPSAIVVDGKLVSNKQFSAIGMFDISADGKHVAFSAGDGLEGKIINTYFVMIDQQKGPEYDGILAGPWFSADGKTVSYAALKENDLYWVEDAVNP